MKACFPVAHDRGLESRVYPHFGSAPMFLVVDTDTKTTRAIPNTDCDHAHGRCHPTDALMGQEIDAVVVSGIGPGALERLREVRIRVYHTSRAAIGEALDAIAHGTLPPVLGEDGVGLGIHGGGHGRGHHRHGHHHGAGHGSHRHRRGNG